MAYFTRTGSVLSLSSDTQMGFQQFSDQDDGGHSKHEHDHPEPRRRHLTGILKKPKTAQVDFDSSAGVKDHIGDSFVADYDKISPERLQSPFNKSPSTSPLPTPFHSDEMPDCEKKPDFECHESRSYSERSQEMFHSEDKENEDNHATIPRAITEDDSVSTWVVSTRVRHRSNIDSFDTSQLDFNDERDISNYDGTLKQHLNDAVLISSSDVTEMCENHSKNNNDSISDKGHCNKSLYDTMIASSSNQLNKRTGKPQDSKKYNGSTALDALEASKRTSAVYLSKNETVPRTSNVKNFTSAKEILEKVASRDISLENKSFTNFKRWYPRSFSSSLTKQKLQMSQEYLLKTNFDEKVNNSNSQNNFGSQTKLFETSSKIENVEKIHRTPLNRAHSVNSLINEKFAHSFDHDNRVDSSLEKTYRDEYSNLPYSYSMNEDKVLSVTPRNRVRHKSMVELDQHRGPLEFVRDDLVYDYDRSMPYRSSAVYRYQHNAKTDSFLPPDGTLRYSQQIECKKAIPPDRRRSMSQKIFDEYQEKLAERIERKSNRTLRLNKPRKELERPPEDYGVIGQLQKEFMGRVQEKTNHTDITDSSVFPEKDQPRKDYTIEGNAEKLNEVIEDDVTHLLEVDDSVDLKPRLRDVLYRNQLKNSIKKAAVKGSSFYQRSYSVEGYHNPQALTRGSNIFVESNLDTLKPNSEFRQNHYNSEKEIYFNDDDTYQKYPRYKEQSPTLAMLRNRDSKIFPRSSKYSTLLNVTPFAAPKEKIYNVKREYEQVLDGQIRKFFDLSRIPVRGVGPTTNTGMPTSLKSSVDQTHQPEWYRRMYGSINQPAHKPADLSGGTLARWKMLAQDSSTDSDSDVQLYSNLRTARFKNQPNRIENYRPGRCSLSAREAYQEDIRTPHTLLQQKNHNQAAEKARSMSIERQQRMNRGSHSATPTADRLRNSRSKSPRTLSSPQANSYTTDGCENSKRETCPSDVNFDSSNQSALNSSYLKSSNSPCPPAPTQHISGNKNPDEEEHDGLSNKSRVYEPDLSKVRVLHSFQPIRRGELQLQRGEMVTVLGRSDDDNWLYGEIDGRCGLFPANYVARTRQCSCSPSVVAELARAVACHDFCGRTALELSFRQGDVLTVTRTVDTDWHEARFDNKVGLVPTAYIEFQR